MSRLLVGIRSLEGLGRQIRAGRNLTEAERTQLLEIGELVTQVRNLSIYNDAQSQHDTQVGIARVWGLTPARVSQIVKEVRATHAAG